MPGHPECALFEPRNGVWDSTQPDYSLVARVTKKGSSGNGRGSTVLLQAPGDSTAVGTAEEDGNPLHKVCKNGCYTKPLRHTQPPQQCCAGLKPP